MSKSHHVELDDWSKDSPSATLVGTPASVGNHSDSYFNMESPQKISDFQEFTVSASGEEFVYPYHVSYHDHAVVIDSIDFTESTRLKFQILVAFMFLIFTGLADQTCGTLLPSLVEYYKVDHSVVSHIFIAEFCGSLVAARLSDYLHKSVGIFGILSVSCCSWCLCFTIASFAPPFWLLTGVYFFSGFAGGAANGSLNIWGGKLKYHNQIMGFLHAFFGFGCMITPVLATYLLEHGLEWPHWYYVLICGSIVLITCTYFSFCKETQWKYLYLLDNDSSEDFDDDSFEMSNPQEEVNFSMLIKNKYVWFFSITLFFYVGGESSLGSWIYNYLIIIKELSASSSSYITSGFWLSLTLGRGVLGIYIGRKFENNETTVAFILCVLISIFTLIFTVVSSLIIQSISICLVGAFVGPVFPTTIIVALKVLPANIHAFGVGFISSCGSSGAALIPYIIGYVSAMNSGQPGYVEGEGLKYFPAISLGVFSCSMLMWGGFYAYQEKLKRVRLQTA